LAKKKVLFHHDNEPAHSFGIAAAKFQKLCYELLPQPPCSPDLAPYDSFLFPNMKIWLGEKYSARTKRFSSRQKRILKSLTNRIFWRD